MDIAAAKKQLRAQAVEQRRAAFEAAGPDAGAHLAQNVIATALIGPEDIVSGFWPMGEEIDLLPLLTALDARGNVCALPVMERKNAPLIFREWRPGLELRPVGFGVLEPPPSSPKRIPTVVLTPLLVFDARGYRVGYGGGYYDRTLAQLRERGPVTAVGVGYSAQEIEAVPHDHYDQPLDWIVTERGARKFDRAAKIARKVL
jgi:5-formyltetrahydrofolate cyclo-ligase